MGRELLAAIGGFVAGTALGIAVGGALAAKVPWLAMAGGAIMALLGGVLIGSSRSRRAAEPPRFLGRVVEYPHAPVLVEIALRRAGFVVRRREER